MRSFSRLSRGYGVLLAALLAAFASGPSNAVAQQERSPFTDVEFQTSVTISVVYEGRRCELLAIEGTPVDRLVAFARQRFGEKWEKRIAEDLVEVLTGLGHSVGGAVSLKLRDHETGEIVEVANARLLSRNRKLIWEARKTREELASLSAFEETLRTKWAYYELRKDSIEKGLRDLRLRVEGVKRVDAALEMQKVIARGIDGHASVDGWRLGGAMLPFLIEPVGRRYVAFTADRSRLLDSERPYLAAIDGRSIEEWLAAASSVAPRGSPQYVRRHALRHLRAIEHWRRGFNDPDPAGPIRVELTSDGGDHAASLSLPTARRIPIYGVWPRSQSALLDGGIGYLRLPRMDQSAVESIREWLPRFRETAGLIVDVRGNGGGSRDALRELAAYLLSSADPPVVANAAKHILNAEFDADHLDPRYLYPADSPRFSASEREAIALFLSRFRPAWDPPAERFSEWHYMVLNRGANPDAFHYSKPVVVLMDAKCFSATDIFLAGMKELPRVMLVGEASGGGSARSVRTRLPSGEVRLASMVSFQPGGQLFDGVGVLPDIEVTPSPEYFVGGRDSALDKAIEILRKEGLD